MSSLLSALLVLTAALVAAPAGEARRQSGGAEGEGFVSLALAPGGEVSVENRRGGVFVEVWNEEQVGLAAVVHGSDASKGATLPKSVKGAKALNGARGAKRVAQRGLPVSVERVGDALVIKIERATTAAAPRVDLKLRVPASARLKVYTSDGEVEVRGVPAALDAQTLSGDLRLALPQRSSANVTAQSLNGSVVIAQGIESESAPGRTLRGKLQTRLGSGGSVVNLFSGRGRISLDSLGRGAEEVERARGVESGRGLESSAGGVSVRDAVRPSRVKQTQDDAPLKVARPRPEPSETPQEVDEDEVVRVESDLVTLNVSVIDRASGRGLQGLTAEEFHVFEDNVEQHVEHFETAEAPFDLLLLLDLSGSTSRVTETIRAAARRFVAVTRPQDRVGVIAFAGEASVVSPLTSDRAALRASLDRLAAPKGDTRLHDSLAYALDFLERGADPARRRALIVMSDGLDSSLPNVTGVGSTVSYEEIRSRVQEFDGVVYGVWTNTEFYEAFSPLDIQPETYDLAHDRMQELAAAGGGTFYEVEKLEDLAGAYERVVADLGTVYSLTYRPINKRRDGSWRAIRVRLPRRPEAVARGRRGYYAK
ncbi:MAG: Ca-activated chloride channel [Acidobacteriota bacterium]|nr:Ca-activated chloride channel [Acidobacteriota bacterium]